jgi:hypothetical protein
MESIGAAEFIPKGVVVNTKEQFPDLDDLDDAAPKKKKGGAKKKKVVAKVKVEQEEEQVDETTPWRGKKSEFFVMAENPNPPAEMDPNNPMNLELN